MAEQLSEGPGNGGIAKSASRKQGVKRKLDQKTLETKYNAIIECETGQKSKTEIAKMFGVPKNTLSGWLKKAETIKEGYMKFGAKRRNMRTGNHEDLESAVLRWFTDVLIPDIPVSGPILLEKATFFADQLGIDNFKQSSGWLERFKERHGITFKTVCGEAKSVSSSDVDKWTVILNSVLNRYDSRDIYNADETALFYKLTPDKTLEFKTETCVGGKRSKEIITVLVCANMADDDKIPLFVIGKSKNPRCFKNIKTLPTQYTNNKKAWMTGDIFKKWLQDLDKRFQKENRKVAMVIDNCPAHPKVAGLRMIELVFLPPNTTSKTQPMDQGIIKNLKVKYRKQIVRKQIRAIDRNVDFQITLIDALRLLRQSWSAVKQETIKNCYSHAGFKGTRSEITVGNTESEDEDDDIPIADLVEIMKMKESEMNEYINIDLNIPVCAETSDKDIIEDLITSRVTEVPEIDDEDTDESVPTQPTPISDAIKACETLKQFFEEQENTDHEISMMCSVYKSLAKFEFLKRSAVQTSIKDFFKK